MYIGTSCHFKMPVMRRLVLRHVPVYRSTHDLTFSEVHFPQRNGCNVFTVFMYCSLIVRFLAAETQAMYQIGLFETRLFQNPTGFQQMMITFIPFVHFSFEIFTKFHIHRCPAAGHPGLNGSKPQDVSGQRQTQTRFRGRLGAGPKATGRPTTGAH